MTKNLKAKVLRPFMKVKWWVASKKRERGMECRTVKEILAKRDELYARSLKQDREGDAAGYGESKSFIKALDWMLVSKEEK